MLDALELLDAIVACKSFVRAGERVGLSQSGVSRAVARLEEEVGVRLFDRTARAVALTDEGRRFHARVAPLVRGLEDAMADAAGEAGRVRGKLRINTDVFFTRHAIAARLGAFLAQYPELELELVVRPQAGDLVSDGFDAAVRWGEPTTRGLIARKLLETRIVTCAAPSYLGRHGWPPDPQALARHECIQFIDPGTLRPFEWEFHRGRRKLIVPTRGRLTVDDAAAAIGACLAGHGIAQLMELGNAGHIRDGALVELFPRWRDERFPLYAFHPSRRLPPAKVRAFIDFVVASAAAVR
ncbi:MAG TPA: LysR family transcriptional regulator [Kofleriaceae bacterium]|jgi:DNA-binding transcriptional LysR family regulator